MTKTLEAIRKTRHALYEQKGVPTRLSVNIAMLETIADELYSATQPYSPKQWRLKVLNDVKAGTFKVYGLVVDLDDRATEAKVHGSE